MDSASGFSCVISCNGTHCDGGALGLREFIARTDPTSSEHNYVVFIVACTSFLTLVMTTVTCLILLRLCRRGEYKGHEQAAETGRDTGEPPELDPRRPPHWDTRRTRVIQSGFYAKIDSSEMEQSSGTYVPPDFQDVVMILDSDMESDGECECRQPSDLVRHAPGSPRYVDHPKSLAQYENLPPDQAWSSLRSHSHTSRPNSGTRRTGVTDAVDRRSTAMDRESLDIEIPLMEHHGTKGQRARSTAERPTSSLSYLVPENPEMGYLSPAAAIASLDDGYLVPQNEDSGYLTPQEQMVCGPSSTRTSPRATSGNRDAKGGERSVQTPASPREYNRLRQKRQCYSMVSGYIRKTPPHSDLRSRKHNGKETVPLQRDVSCSSPNGNTGFQKVILLKKRKHIPSVGLSSGIASGSDREQTNCHGSIRTQAKEAETNSQLSRTQSERASGQSSPMTGVRPRPLTVQPSTRETKHKQQDRTPSIIVTSDKSSLGSNSPQVLKKNTERTVPSAAQYNTADSQIPESETDISSTSSAQDLCPDTMPQRGRTGSWKVPRNTPIENTAMYSLRRASFHNRTSKQKLPAEERRSLPVFSTFKPELVTRSTDQPDSVLTTNSKEGASSVGETPVGLAVTDSQDIVEPASPTYMCMSGLGAARVTDTIPMVPLERAARPEEGSVRSVPATPQSRRSTEPDLTTGARRVQNSSAPKDQHVDTRKAQSLPGTPRLSIRAKPPEQEPEYANMEVDSIHNWRV